MKKTAVFFRILGCLLTALTLALCFSASQLSPVILLKPAGAQSCIRRFSNALNAGDLAEASRCLYGNPTLAGSLDGSDAAATLWAAYCSSLQCSTDGSVQAVDNGVSADLTIGSMDLAAALEQMKASAPERLEALAAGDPANACDETGAYRKELQAQAMQEAAALADTSVRAQTVRVNLICEQGQWLILPDSTLLHLLSGGLL